MRMHSFLCVSYVHISACFQSIYFNGHSGSEPREPPEKAAPRILQSHKVGQCRETAGTYARNPAHAAARRALHADPEARVSPPWSNDSVHVIIFKTILYSNKSADPSKSCVWRTAQVLPHFTGGENRLMCPSHMANRWQSQKIILSQWQRQHRTRSGSSESENSVS